MRLGGSDDFITASDASYADNTLDRKSSQAYVIKLFGGAIGWRANKQATVSTSTTEAELLALSQAAKESYFQMRLLKEIGVSLDSWKVVIECDNTNTVRIVNEQSNQFTTALRHIDTHNHWLRQEAKTRRLVVNYVPSNKQLADGLTKTLQQQAFTSFVDQLELEDISDRIQSKRLKELKEEDYDFNALVDSFYAGSRSIRPSQVEQRMKVAQSQWHANGMRMVSSSRKRPEVGFSG